MKPIHIYDLSKRYWIDVWCVGGWHLNIIIFVCVCICIWWSGLGGRQLWHLYLIWIHRGKVYIEKDYTAVGVHKKALKRWRKFYMFQVLFILCLLLYMVPFLATDFLTPRHVFMPTRLFIRCLVFVYTIWVFIHLWRLALKRTKVEFGEHDYGDRKIEL